MRTATLPVSGELSLRVTRGWPSIHEQNTLRHALPSLKLDAEVAAWRRSNLRNVMRGYWRHSIADKLGVGHFTGALFLTVFRGDGTVLPLGLASMRVVTTAGCTFIRDDFNAGSTDITTMKFHGFGTGTTAEATGDTALVTELTTQYATDSTRPTGSQTTNGTTVYRTIATLTPDSGGTIAVTEHGIFSASSSGTLLDRSKFSAVNLDSTAGDSLQATYDFTITAGG
jgi:hypothetical protein